MDKLKNFIDTNREAFEDDLLPEGHFERFEQKLAVPRKSRATLYSLCAFAAAACIALLFLFKLPGGTPLPIQPRQVVTGQHACEVKEEIEELRLYYNMQMSDIISQMQAMYKLQRTPGTEELLKETKRSPDRQLYVRRNGPSDSALLQCRPLCHEPALQYQLGKSQHHVETDGEYGRFQQE